MDAQKQEEADDRDEVYDACHIKHAVYKLVEPVEEGQLLHHLGEQPFEPGTVEQVPDVVEIEVYSKESGYLEQCRKDLGCLKGCVNVEEIQADSCFRDDFVI